MTNINHGWFTEALAARSESQRSMARGLDLDPSAVSLILSGKRRISMKIAGRMAVFLRVPVEDVLRASGMEGLEPRVGEFPQFDLVGTVDDQRKITPISQSTVFGHRDLTPDTVAVRAQTTGTAEDHIDGWLFFFRESEEMDPSLIAKLCVAEDDKGIKRIGNLRRGYGGSNIWNLDRGRTVLENLKIVSATPVIWIKP